jgi:hypothetical protein
MDHGRFIQRCFQSALLIAMAIQGLTPGLNDLASTSALRLLCSYTGDQHYSQLDDGAPDNVCELFEWSQRLEGSRVGNDVGVAGPASFPAFPVTLRFPIVRSSAESPLVQPVHPSLHELCRIAC